MKTTSLSYCSVATFNTTRLALRKDNAYGRMEFSRKKQVAVHDSLLYVVAPKDLGLSKLDWAKESRSELQLTDVRNLLRSVKGLDRHYLARWAKRLGVESLLRSRRSED